MSIPARETELISSVAEFEVFASLPENAARNLEYIGGELIEVGSNDIATMVAARINWLLGNTVYPDTLGHLSSSDGGYAIGNERYIPDVAYISKERYPKPKGVTWIPIAPDLAVEVLSPSNTGKEIAIKLSNYLAAGTVVWMVDPDDETVSVHEPGKAAQILRESDTLTGGDVLPGFSVTVKDIFKV